jgi:hypothetical protein
MIDTRPLVRTGVAFVLGVAGATAAADVALYENGDTKANFALTVVTAAFQNSDSWFGNSEDFNGADTDSWNELGAEPGFNLEFALGGGTAFAAVSGVYTKTFGDDASGLTVGQDDPDDMTLEQAHIGWRMDDAFAGLTNDTVTLSIGRQDYSIGNGLIINDGASDGGERGGWYIGMRKAFPRMALAKVKSDETLLEAFYLENDPRRGGTRGKAFGLNGEYYFGGKGTLGGSYVLADAKLPGVDELDIYSARGEIKPVTGLSIAGEFVHEESEEIDADGYYGQAVYEFQDVAWSPALTYRYAHFDGDDPNTDKDEQFREVAYGYTDYGYWFQGEITGNYPLANGNVISHMVRAKATPVEDVTVSLFYYDFTLDQEQIFGDPVSDDEWGQEVNLTVDWAATEHLYLIGVLGTLKPGNAAEEWVGGGGDWNYLMLYVSYTL